MHDVDNLSIPLGGGARAHTRPELADPTSIATLHNETIAHTAIALRLITLAFGPVVSRNLHSLRDRTHGPSLGTDGSNPALSSGESNEPPALAKHQSTSAVKRLADGSWRQNVLRGHPQHLRQRHPCISPASPVTNPNWPGPTTDQGISPLYEIAYRDLKLPRISAALVRRNRPQPQPQDWPA
jgi:hypothetical protein